MSVARQSPSPWDVVRPGVFLYGVGGAEGSHVRPEGVASLRARVIEIRPVRCNPRQRWAEDARRIADQGDDALLWPEVANQGDDELVW